MSTILRILAVAAPTSALAHPGHVETLQGHDHWIAVAALVAAGLVTAFAVVRARRRKRRAAQRDAAPLEARR